MTTTISAEPICPEPPDFRLDWDAIEDRFAWVQAMSGCSQDEIYHAEGDVRIHTRMVCESLLASKAWRALPGDERRIVFLASLMHDIAKPLCTRIEDGRITSRGHSGRGARVAREILWRMRLPLPDREQIAALIRWHQVPFFLIDHRDHRRRLYEVSQTARCDLLALVTEADARGRICSDQQRLLDNIELFKQLADEHDCLSAPRQFQNAHSRFLYFRRTDRDPDYAAFDDTTCEVILMSGLPGAGKDSWIATKGPDWPVISLDALRRELKIAATDTQGPVIARARESAREYLRRGQSFIWNATNISRSMRELVINLCAAYNARIHIVYLETDEQTLLARNASRAERVPGKAINRMIEKWEVPDLTEAHRIDWLCDDQIIPKNGVQPSGQWH